MTLQELFESISQNPTPICAFFALIPLTAGIAAILGNGEGTISPWKYLYATLVYLTCIPGFFALTLTAYFFLFERRSILLTDVYIQILPILSMALTLFLIAKNVSLDDVPGFGKISGLGAMIVGTIAFMWFLDKTHLIAFVSMSFYQLLAVFIVFFLFIRWGWRKITNI